MKIFKANSKIKKFFKDWEDGLVLSFLQGYMGFAIVDDKENPKSVQIVVGDFSFFAGVANKSLLKEGTASILTCQNEDWAREIELFFKDTIIKKKRYKMKSSVSNFDKDKLISFINSLDKKYTLKQIDKHLYYKVLSNSWSADLCSQFKNADEFVEKGLGFVILKDGEIISGASSYVIYDNSIEIEIDTKREFREKGFATVCGAKLILECLNKGLLPSWDAQDLRSVALAEKLGFIFDQPYNAYYLVENK